MPELPEVRTIATLLNNVCKDKVIQKVDVRLAKLIKEVSAPDFVNDLVNRTIISVTNRAKFLVFHFSDARIMLSHLRMEGKYHTSPWPASAAVHDHIVFHFSDNTALFYNDTRQFGTFHLRHESDYLLQNPLAKLGPEPRNANLDEFYKKLQRGRRPIKVTLLDQEVISGLGNIYVDEILWAVAVHPLTPANQITKLVASKMLISAKEIIMAATKMGGTTVHTFQSFNGVTGGFQNELKVHMQDRKSCPRCGTIIVKTRVAGRGTYFCPREQIFDPII